MRSELLEPWRPARDDPWDRAAATHLLRRAGFGPRPDQVERALERGLDATLAEVLAPPGHDPRELAGIEALLPAGNIENVQAWWMALILGDGAPLVERVTFCWHDHFATSNDKVGDAVLMHRQNRLLRERGLGDFRALLHAVARDPAMLLWLDGNDNKSGAPNENFARELFELFALGIGRYTERDVQEAARALTGWGTAGRAFAMREIWHDAGSKTVFGRTESFDGDALIDWVLEQPACAPYVARTLLCEFVGRDAGSEIERELAEVLVENEWSIARTLEVLLRSKLFFARASRGSRIAGPVELVALTVRALDAHVAPAAAARAAARMGQSLLRPPSVKGWDGGRAWIHAGAWIARHEWMAQLVEADGRKEGTLQLDLQRVFGDAAKADGACDAVFAALAPAGVDEAFASRVRQAARESSPEQALRNVVLLVLTAPEFHFT